MNRKSIRPQIINPIYRLATVIVLLFFVLGSLSCSGIKIAQNTEDSTTDSKSQEALEAEAEKASQKLSAVMESYEGKIDSYEMIEKALDEEYAAAEKLKEEGIATYIEKNDLNIFVEFSSGESMIIPVPLDGFLGSGDDEEFRVVCYRPFNSEVEQTYEDFDGVIKGFHSRTQEAAKRVVKQYSSYVMKASDCKDNEDVDLDDVLNLKGASLIVWEGHGDYVVKYGCVLKLPIAYDEVKNNPDYYDDCINGRIGRYEDGAIFINSKFFDAHFDKQDFLNCIVMLGACNSGRTASLANAFLDRGALCVTGNTNSVPKTQEHAYAEAFLDSLTAGETSETALAEAQKAGQSEEIWDILQDWTDPLSENGTFNNDYILYGLKNAFLSNEYVYYATTKANNTIDIRYPFSGVLGTKEGETYLAKDELYLRIDEDVLVCCDNETQYISEFRLSPALVDELLDYDGYYVEMNSYLLQDENGEIFIGCADDLTIGLQVNEPSKKMEEIESEPCQNVAIDEIKLYDKLLDFLDESFDTVMEYYGKPSYISCIDGGGDLYWYEYDNYTLMFGAEYDGEDVVDRINLLLTEVPSDVKITTGATSSMIEVTAHNALTLDGFDCEVYHYYNDDDESTESILQCVSGNGMIWYHWNSLSFNDDDMTKRPCCVYLYSSRIMNSYQRD